MSGGFHQVRHSRTLLNVVSFESVWRVKGMCDTARESLIRYHSTRASSVLLNVLLVISTRFGEDEG